MAKSAKDIRNDLVYGFCVALLAMGRRLPRRIGQALCGGLGSLAYLLPTADRASTVENLTAVYGGRWPAATIRATARAVYRNLGVNLFDAVHLLSLPLGKAEQIVRVEGYGPFRAAYDAGRGLVGIAAHTGCFEMQLSFLARKGFDTVAVGRQLFDPRIDALVSGARTLANVTYVHRHEGPRTILRLLRQGRAFATLIDQDTDAEGVFARFLGKTAYTPSGPVKLAMRYGFPLFVLTTARMPDNTHRIRVTGPLALDSTGDFDRDLVMNVQRVNDILSDAIEKYPDQWVWMHRRWKRKPADPGMEAVPSIENYEAEERKSVRT